MRNYPSGTITWAQDPTDSHPERPVVVVSHDDRPYNSIECTVICLGTDGDKYDHPTPEIKERHLTGITFGSQTYLLPWAIYTIPPSSLLGGKPIGQLSQEGEKLVAESLYRLVRGRW